MTLEHQPGLLDEIMNNPEKEHSEFLQPTAIQLSQARALGLDLENLSDAAALVHAMDEHLGKKAIEWQAYWYVMSVWRDLQNGQWQTPKDSGLDDATLESVLRKFLERRETRYSLTRVLAESRYRYSLVSFAERRDMQELTLTRTTKAYRFAVAALSEVALASAEAPINASADGSDPEPDRADSSTSKSIVDRRAARRAREFDSAVASVARSVNDMQEKPATNLARPVAELSDEEYSELQEVLQDDESEIKIVHSRRRLGVSGERVSLLLGLVTGLLFFVAAQWVLF